jgi:hypothetical protein
VRGRGGPENGVTNEDNSGGLTVFTDELNVFPGIVLGDEVTQVEERNGGG